jgi:hypothetical protein
MTTKEKISRIVEAMPENEAEELLQQLEEQPASPSVEKPKYGIHALSELLDEIARNAPEEELKKIPPDFSENLDHYLYGSPKRTGT